MRVCDLGPSILQQHVNDCLPKKQAGSWADSSRTCRNPSALGTRYKKLTRDRYKSDLLNDHGSPIGVELGITTAWRLIRLQADRLNLNEAGGWPMKTQNGSEDDAHV